MGNCYCICNAEKNQSKKIIHTYNKQIPFSVIPKKFCMKKFLIIIFIGFTGLSVFSQELSCRVSVIISNMKGAGSSSVDKSVFKALEGNLTSFMNDRKWTEYNLKTIEKIECSMQLVIVEALGGDMYEGKINVNLNRPVYNSTYSSPLLSYEDHYVRFKYTANQQFDYDENSYLWTITSIAAYYANLFLALSFDTYSVNGGTPFYNKCVNIISSAPPNGEVGWSNTTKERQNRYWLLESFTNPSYDALRKFLYQYHRNGLDVMAQSTQTGVSTILSALESLQTLHTTYPSNAATVIMCMTKSIELTNIFSGATTEEKQKAANILKRINPSNSEKYDKMLKQ